MRNRAKKNGFTLLEMLIVIGLLVIVTTVAIPQFKKSFDDIHINKTLDDLDSLLQSTRSYYLVMNEFPEDRRPGRMPIDANWVFQSNFLGSKEKVDEEYYNLIVKPWNGYHYDWDCWNDDDVHIAEWCILLTGQSEQSKANRALFENKIKQRYGKVNNSIKGDNKDFLYLNFSLLETPKTGKEANYWNRYY